MRIGKLVIEPQTIAGVALYVLSLALPLARGAVTGNVVNHLSVSSLLFFTGCAVCYHHGRRGHGILFFVTMLLVACVVRLSSGHLWRFLLKPDAEVYLYWGLSLAAGVLVGWGAVQDERQEADNGGPTPAE